MVTAMKKLIALMLCAAAVFATSVLGLTAEAKSAEASPEIASQETEQTVGGWRRAESPVVTDELKAKLEKALDGMLGADYTPVAYLGSQLVAGTNYKFLCRVAPVVPGAVETFAIVTLYEDLDGQLRITEVQDFAAETNLSGAPLPGGWAQAESPVVTDELQAVFEKALEGLLGVEYVPVALVSSQVVAGMNYCFLCESTVVYPGAETTYALVCVYKDLQGNAEITDIVVLAEDAGGEASAEASGDLF